MNLTFKKPTTPTLSSEKVKKIPWQIGRYAFSIILLLIFLLLLIGIYLFYSYVVTVKNQPTETLQGTFKFEYTKYQKVLDAWKEKDQYLTTLSNTNTLDPFKMGQQPTK